MSDRKARLREAILGAMPEHGFAICNSLDRNDLADTILAAVVAVLDEDERDEWRVCIRKPRKPSYSDYPMVYGTAWDRAEAEDDLDACRKLYVDDEPWMESRRVRKTDWERVPDATR